MNTTTGNTSDEQLLESAFTRANEMVLGASMAIMDSDSTPAQQNQGRYFQSLFSAVRDVLQDAMHGNDPSRSRAVMDLARGVLGADIEEVR